MYILFLHIITQFYKFFMQIFRNPEIVQIMGFHSTKVHSITRKQEKKSTIILLGEFGIMYINECISKMLHFQDENFF